MRWVCAAAAAALLAGPAAAWPGDPDPPRVKSGTWPDALEWIAEHLDLDGWISAGGANRTYWFVSSLPNTAPDYPLVQDWVRGEEAADKPARSFLWRIEVDCSSKRNRLLESYNYSRNNLRGRFAAIPTTANADWRDTAEGSVSRTIVETICRGARR